MKIETCLKPRSDSNCLVIRFKNPLKNRILLKNHWRGPVFSCHRPNASIKQVKTNLEIILGDNTPWQPTSNWGYKMFESSRFKCIHACGLYIWVVHKDCIYGLYMGYNYLKIYGLYMGYIYNDNHIYRRHWKNVPFQRVKLNYLQKKQMLSNRPCALC